MSGDGWVKLAKVGELVGGILRGGGAICAKGEEPPEDEPMRPFWVKNRLSESQSEVKRAESNAQSQSSAWRMLSTRSEWKQHRDT